MNRGAAGQDGGGPGNDGRGDAAASLPDASSTTDSGADAAPSTPETARTITAGEAIAGAVAAGDESAHWFKYVPAQAFTSVSVSLTTLEPQDGLGTIRWQTTTMLGLCDLTGGFVCCNGAIASTDDCNLTIREGRTSPYAPVTPGKAYYIIVVGDAAGPTSYAFRLTETP